MTDENKKQESLVHIGSANLVKVGNAIELINRLLAKESVRMIPFRIGYSWYIYNLDSKAIVSDRFDFIELIDSSTKESTALILSNYNPVLKAKEYAVINNPSKLSTLLWYDALNSLSANKFRLITSKNGKFGLVDVNGIELIKCTFDKIIEVRFNGVLIVKFGNKYGIIELQSFEIILPVEFDFIEELCSISYSLEFLKVRQDINIGVFDCKSRTMLFLSEFDDVACCNDGICPVKINSKWGLFDLELKKVISATVFDSIDVFEHGYSICYKNDQGYFAVNRNGVEEKINLNISIERVLNLIRDNDVLIAKEIEYRQHHFGSRTSIYKFHIYKKLIFVATILHEENARHTNIILKNGEIQIQEAGKYGGYRTVRWFDTNGREILKNESEKLLDNVLNRNLKKVRESDWKIEGSQLYYRGVLIYEGEGWLEANLNLDFPILNDIIDDFDPDFCHGQHVGYIDQNGNTYWREE